MIVKRKTRNPKMFLCHVAVGDVFDLGPSTFIKTDCVGRNMVSCVNLTSGKLTRIPYDSEVTPLKVELVEV